VVRVGLSCARHADGENGATCVGCKDGAAQRRAIACAGVSQMWGVHEEGWFGITIRRGTVGLRDVGRPEGWVMYVYSVAW
jgi:hypothetical protein